jgi:hypothetical protein
MTDKTLVGELNELFNETHLKSEYGKILLTVKAQDRHEFELRVPLTEKGLASLGSSVLIEIEGLRKAILRVADQIDHAP